ncbi:MAG: response regulator transcription factor [Phycisphaerales bacterium]|jgi:two-component system phosphate regulon response regulator PhoB|nr:response regulator transcription factor [Phycisphaerales bacterium]
MDETQNILVVEDEPAISSLIRLHLDRNGFVSHLASSGKEAIDLLSNRSFDLILLDLMLPDISGLDICKKINNVPIIIVSALSDESDVVSGLELGAVDYVTKPFSPKILLARVRAVLRRTELVEDSRSITLYANRLCIDHDKRAVKVDENPIALTQSEYDILSYLAARPGFVKTRDQISQSLHGHQAVLSTRTIDVHITSLRKKLGELSSVVETVRGVGYRLAERIGWEGCT